MPAPVLVVHDESDTREEMLAALRAAGHDSIGYHDPMLALDAIESDTRVRVLVARVDFGPGKLNGDALARMVRHKRPSVKAVFVGRPENGRYVQGAGEFLPHPVDLQALVEAVARHLADQREG
jgi:DNA-binding NtrC family response regulator